MKFSALHWGFLPALIALSVLHYVCAAIALQAAAGQPLPLREATLTQFTAYFIGSAAGSALPVPAAIGSTEAALIAALGGAGVSAGHALQAIVVFRAITYWAPVPVGLFATRALRRSQAKPSAPAPAPAQ